MTNTHTKIIITVTLCNGQVLELQEMKYFFQSFLESQHMHSECFKGETWDGLLVLWKRPWTIPSEVDQLNQDYCTYHHQETEFRLQHPWLEKMIYFYVLRKADKKTDTRINEWPRKILFSEASPVSRNKKKPEQCCLIVVDIPRFMDWRERLVAQILLIASKIRNSKLLLED